MATIRPFRGIRPANNEHSIFNSYDAGYLRLRLQGGDSPLSPSLDECAEHLQQLLLSGELVQETELAFYMYEAESVGRTARGIFALNSLKDLSAGNILMHEAVLNEVQQQLLEYRETVGLEGEAILLVHEPNALISELINKAVASGPSFCYQHEGTRHSFYKVSSPQQLSELQLAFSALRQVYLADGHHRLSAAEKAGADWVSALYLSADDIQIQAYHRVVLPYPDFDFSSAIGPMGEYFFVSLIPGNVAYRPLRPGRFGMWVNGQWYQLDLRPELLAERLVDAEFLQQKILSRIFGISEPRTDPRLKCFSDNEWKKLLLEIAREPAAVVFTLCPIGSDEFISLSLDGRILPPKSTSIGPKPVYGQLMHLAGHRERREER